jgi:hypothetical protein
MRSLCLVALVTLLFASRPVRAGDGVVIESYGGPRPAGATRALQTVFEELMKRESQAGPGFVAGVDVVGRRFETRVSRPAVTAVGLPPEFAAQIDAGHKA